MTKKLMVALLLLMGSAFAQDQAAAARNAAGCGANEATFNVKTDNKQHPMAQPQAGKAVVYVFDDEDVDNVTLHIGGATTRWGLDGSWVGANYRKSYFFFYVDPGDHRVCTSRQSSLKSQTKISSAISFTAEVGKAYYFRTKTPHHKNQTAENAVIVEAVDPAAAQLLIANSALSISHPKPPSDDGE